MSSGTAHVRSWLYVPGDRADMRARAFERGADALILDLEDAIAVVAKSAARDAVASWLGGPGAQGPAALWVRVNAGDRLADDVTAIVGPRVDGVMVPKVDGPEELAAAIDRVRAAERLVSQPVGRVGVVPLVETARGLLEASMIARVPGVTTLALGEGDLAADLGVTPSRGEPEFQFARSLVVVAAAAAGLDAPIAPVATDVRDLEAFRRSSEQLRRMGFGSRQAIHPAQVEVVNDVYTPPPEEVEMARETVALFERAAAARIGVVVDGSGRMVDEAIVRAARRTLARAGTGPGREEER